MEGVTQVVEQHKEYWPCKHRLEVYIYIYIYICTRGLIKFIYACVDIYGENKLTAPVTNLLIPPFAGAESGECQTSRGPVGSLATTPTHSCVMTESSMLVPISARNRTLLCVQKARVQKALNDIALRMIHEGDSCHLMGK